MSPCDVTLFTVPCSVNPAPVQMDSNQGGIQTGLPVDTPAPWEEARILQALKKKLSSAWRRSCWRSDKSVNSPKKLSKTWFNRSEKPLVVGNIVLSCFLSGTSSSTAPWNPTTRAEQTSRCPSSGGHHRGRAWAGCRQYDWESLQQSLGELRPALSSFRQEWFGEVTKIQSSEQ